MKAALKEFEKMPENQIFIIPVRVDDCNIPYSLQKLHVVDLFQNNGIDKVIQSIEYSQIKSNSVVDQRDGEVYATIEINGKTWLAENLRYLGGKGCWINGTNKDVFGYLYTLESAKEACSPGWHIPTYFEWMELVAYIDGFSTNDGYEDEYKEDEKIITIGSPSFEKSIQLIRSGFKVPLPGIRSEDDRFILKNKYASFWSSTFVSNEVWIWSFNLYTMYFHGDKLDLDSTLNIGMSCRCVKDFNHQTNWS